MRRHAFLHFFFFVTFFSIGAGALGTAVLADDFVQYCRNRQLLRHAEASLKQLESLNVDYDILLQQLQSDPDLLKRLAPVTLGTEPADPDMARPKAEAQELAASRKALAEQAQQEPTPPEIPVWLQRCSDPAKRMILFIAGASLVLISLVCFTADATETPRAKSEA
jgi:hypothetical protein